MTKRFDILHRDQTIHQNTLLEASAGTGKTFSMENLFVRLLIEPDNNKNGQTYSVERILAVTFTKAATKELKERIRKALIKSLDILKHALQGKSITDVPDFLLKVIEEGESVLLTAKKKIERALFCFDDAKIFTMHGFCNRMLKDFSFESDWAGACADFEESSLQVMQIKKTIHNLFHTGIRPEKFSHKQIEIALKNNKSDPKKLTNTIQGILSKNLPILSCLDYESSFSRFVKAMNEIKKDHSITPKAILNDFYLNVPHYKEICDKKNNIHPENKDKIEKFASLFDRREPSKEDFDFLIANGLVYCEMLADDKRKAKGNPPHPESLQLPFFNDLIKHKLHSLVTEASSYSAILASLSAKSQILLSNYTEEEELHTHDNLLSNMHKAIKHPEFADCVRKQFDCVIIDEFQDTDPLQWDIFSSLFLKTSEKPYLYLVGDPKQSIYSFRQADIYTYLNAANTIGEEHKAFLDVNYRSQPSLIEALNELFDSERIPNLITLPRIEQSIAYQKVLTSPKAENKSFSDNYGSIHFCIAPQNQESSNEDKNKSAKHGEECLIQFLANEIIRLKNEDGIAYKQWAVLIRDKIQGMRLCEYLKTRNIPYITQKEENLADSDAVTALIQLLEAVISPFDISLIKIALGGQLICWTYVDFQILENQNAHEEVLAKFQELHSLLHEKGFAAFFHAFLKSIWKPFTHTVAEGILLRDNGLNFYQELLQLSELVIEQESQTGVGPAQLITFLSNLELLQINEDERLNIKRDCSKDAIKILTLHTSKGLEFDIVFALGLAVRPPVKDFLIPSFVNGQKHLIPYLSKEDPAYQAHCNEIDAEKMRQLYVAMTRAKYRLYVPIPYFKTEPLIGEASPIELYLSLFCKDQNGEKITHFLKYLDEIANKKSITYSLQSDNAQELEPNEHCQKPYLEPPLTFNAVFPGHYSFSFTTISKKCPTSNVSHKITLENPPHDFNFENKTTHTLPSSSETGNLLHKILEELALAKVHKFKTSADFAPFVNNYLKNTSYEFWQDAICDILYNTLNVKLPSSQGGFTLSDINPHNTYREMEFLYPIAKGFKNLPLEGFINEGDYLKGVIDFAFMHNQKYYLIDWKSNWLGPSFDDYSPDNVKSAILHHRYDMQAEIYKEAFKRYLKLVEKRPFNECFGGVFYLFLRGLDCNNEHSNGIHYFPPH